VQGAFAKFRSKALRPVDHRWVEGQRVGLAALKGRFVDRRDTQPAPWHPDQVVSTIARMYRLTNGWEWTPDIDELQPGDDSHLCALDIIADSDMARPRHTLHCLFLGGADGELIEREMGVDAAVTDFIHDAVYDVRSRLDKPVVMSDLVFDPCFMQGGVRNPSDVEKVVSYLCGAETFLAYRFAVYNEDNLAIQASLDRMQEGLLRNQAMSALLRRSFSFESTQQAVQQLHDTVLLAKRQESIGPISEDQRRLGQGMEAIQQQLGVKVSEKGDISAERVEFVTQSSKALSAELQPQEATP